MNSPVNLTSRLCYNATKKYVRIKYRSLKTLLYFTRLHTSKTGKLTEISGSETLVCMLGNQDLWKRFYYPIIYMLYSQGFKIQIVPNRQFLTTRTQKIDDLIFKRIPFKFKKRPKGGSDEIWLIDEAFSKSRLFSDRRFCPPKRILSIQAGYQSRDPSQAGEIDLPFSMFPEVYGSNYPRYNAFYHPLVNDRDIHIFYAGNFDPSVYDAPVNTNQLNNIFHVSPRGKILELILDNTPDDKLLYITHPDQLPLLDCDLKNKTVIVNSFKSGIEHSKYFELLGRSRFTIGMPGIDYPWSHNLPESLFMGCVPIMQFPLKISDKMISGVNCVKFDEIGELPQILAQCRSLPLGTIAALTQNARLLYDETFSPRAVANLITESLPEQNKIILNVKYG